MHLGRVKVFGTVAGLDHGNGFGEVSFRLGVVTLSDEQVGHIHLKRCDFLLAASTDAMYNVQGLLERAGGFLISTLFPVNFTENPQGIGHVRVFLVIDLLLEFQT